MPRWSELQQRREAPAAEAGDRPGADDAAPDGAFGAGRGAGRPSRWETYVALHAAGEPAPRAAAGASATFLARAALGCQAMSGQDLSPSARTPSAGVSPQSEEEQDAADSLALSEEELKKGRYEEALVHARAAWALFADTMNEAWAVSLIIQALLAMDRIGEARRLAEGHLAAKDSGRAGATVGLAMAEVHAATGRHREGLRLAERALQTFRAALDEAGAARALETVARVALAFAESAPGPGGAQALAAAEELLALRRRQGGTEEECAALLTMSRAHLARHEYDDAFAFAGAAVELARQRECLASEAVALQDLAAVVLALAETGREDADTAVHYAKDAVEMCRSMGDRHGELKARQALATAYHKDGMSSFALEQVQLALAISRELGGRAHTAKLLERMSKLHSPEKAITFLTEEAERALQAGDLHLWGEALRRVVTLRSYLGKAEEAVELAASVVRRFEGTAPPGGARDQHRLGQARALMSLAEAREAAKQPKEAFRAATEARELFHQAGDVRGAAEALGAAAGFCEQMGDNRGALRACMDQRAVFKAAGWKDEEAKALLAAARRHAQDASLQEALRLAREGLTMCQEAKDQHGEAAAWLTICDLHANFGFDYSDAMSAAAHARRLSKALGDALGEARALKATAEVLVAQGATEQAAVVRAKEALEVCLQVGDRQGEAFGLQAIADVFQVLVREDTDSGLAPRPAILEEALNFTLLAAAAHGELRDAKSQATTLLQLSHLYVQDGDGDAALQAAKESKDLAEKFEEMTVEASALLAVADAHMVREAWQEAKEAAEDARDMHQDMQDPEGESDAQELIDRAELQLSKQAQEKGGSAASAKPPAAAKKRVERGLWTTVIEAMEKAKLFSKEAAERRRRELLPGPAEAAPPPPPDKGVGRGPEEAPAPPRPQLPAAAMAEPQEAQAEPAGGCTPGGTQYFNLSHDEDEADWMRQLMRDASLQARIEAAVEWVASTGCAEWDLREDAEAFAELCSQLGLRKFEVKRLRAALHGPASDSDSFSVGVSAAASLTEPPGSTPPLAAEPC